MPRVRVNGVQLSYQQAGNGPDLVLIHGLGASLAFWYVLVAPFLARHFRVTAVDLRGHGLSEMPSLDYTSADMARDVSRLLEEFGIERAHLVGHSFGGLVALQCAVRFPEQVDRLVIADSRLPQVQPSVRLGDWLHWPRWKLELEERGIRLDEDLELDFGILELLARHRWRNARRRLERAQFFIPFEGGGWATGRRSTERWLRLLASTSARRDFKKPAGLTVEGLGRVRNPTLALFGEYSFCLPSCHALREAMPQAEVRIVPGVGHFHPRTRPDLFRDTVREFLLPRATPSAGGAPGAGA